MEVLYNFRFVGNLCAVALLLLCSALPTGGQPKNELAAYGGGGLSALSYTLPYGEREDGFGYDAGLVYTRFVGSRIGVGTGVSLSSYSATAQLDGATLILRNQHDDVGGVVYDFHAELLRYREQQQATFVHIPLMLSYHQNKRKSSLYAQGGVKLSIPLIARYESRNGAIRTAGDYVGTLISDPNMGFGEFNNRSTEGTLDLKMVYTAAVEAGIRWRLSSAFALYTGLFADYGLNNALRSPRSENLVRLNAADPKNFTTGSVLDSRYTADNRAVDKLSLMSAGLKVRIAFGFPQFHNTSISNQLRIKNWELERLEELQQLEKQKEEEELKQREEKKAKDEAQQQQQEE
jgi:hypothetical protein